MEWRPPSKSRSRSRSVSAMDWRGTRAARSISRARHPTDLAAIYDDDHPSFPCGKGLEQVNEDKQHSVSDAAVSPTSGPPAPDPHQERERVRRHELLKQRFKAAVHADLFTPPCPRQRSSGSATPAPAVPDAPTTAAAAAAMATAAARAAAAQGLDPNTPEWDAAVSAAAAQLASAAAALAPQPRPSVSAAPPEPAVQDFDQSNSWSLENMLGMGPAQALGAPAPLLGSVAGLGDYVGATVNHDPEYGFLPRLVRKTSFDHKVRDNRSLSRGPAPPAKLRRMDMSGLGPRGTSFAAPHLADGAAEMERGRTLPSRSSPDERMARGLSRFRTSPARDGTDNPQSAPSSTASAFDFALPAPAPLSASKAERATPPDAPPTALFDALAHPSSPGEQGVISSSSQQGGKDSALASTLQGPSGCQRTSDRPTSAGGDMQALMNIFINADALQSPETSTVPSVANEGRDPQVDEAAEGPPASDVVSPRDNTSVAAGSPSSHDPSRLQSFSSPSGNPAQGKGQPATSSENKSGRNGVVRAGSTSASAGPSRASSRRGSVAAPSGSGSGGSTANASGGKEDAAMQCSNCHTSKTPLWRRDPEGHPLCNACGLFYKLHQQKRPLSMKTDVIKKRNRATADRPKPKQRGNSVAAQGQAPGEPTTLLPGPAPASTPGPIPPPPGTGSGLPQISPPKPYPAPAYAPPMPDPSYPTAPYLQRAILAPRHSVSGPPAQPGPNQPAAGSGPGFALPTPPPGSPAYDSQLMGGGLGFLLDMSLHAPGNVPSMFGAPSQSPGMLPLHHNHNHNHNHNPSHTTPSGPNDASAQGMSHVSSVPSGTGVSSPWGGPHMNQMMGMNSVNGYPFPASAQQPGTPNGLQHAMDMLGLAPGPPQ